MVNCAVSSCKRRSATSNLREHGVSYHIFPKDPFLRKEWVTFCHNGDGWVPTRTSVICSDHFDPLSFQLLSNLKNRRKLNENAKPTRLLSHCKNLELNTNSSGKNDMLQSSSMEPSELQVHTDQQLPTLSDPLSSLEPTPLSEPMPSSSSQSQRPDTPRKRKLKKQLEFKNKKIKQLLAKIRYLKKKVNDLQELLNNSSDKSL